MPDSHAAPTGPPWDIIERVSDAVVTPAASVQLLSAQNRILELIARGAPLPESLETLVRVIEAQSPPMLGSVLLLDPDGVHLRHGAAPNLPAAFSRAVDGQPIGPEAGSCGTAAFRGQPVIVEDIAVDPLWAAYRDLALPHGLRACWSTPIFDGRGHVLGTFAMYFRTPGRPDEWQKRLIDLATQTATIAIVKHREAQALLSSEERQRLAVTSGHIGVWEWNVDTNRLSWSDELKAIFGWPPERDDLTQRAFLDAIHPDDQARVKNALRQAIAERTTYDEECRITRTDGVERWIASRGRAEYDASGTPVRMIGICQDTTERKEADERRRRNEKLELEVSQRRKVEQLLRSRNDELKTFASTVSHELKTPLRAIAGYAAELNRRHTAGLSERALLCVQRILTATQNLDRLIEDLLDYARLDAETPTSTTVNLVQAVDAILQERTAAIAEHHSHVTADLAVTTLHTWERGMRQVLANLVDNALKYSRHATPPSISITSARQEGGVLVTIADNGVGFDMKYHDRMFGMFNRLVLQEQFEGTGAGLAIVKKIVDKIGGDIRAESSPGAGATFFLTVPQRFVESGGDKA